MARRILLHFGAPKSGSTFLQRVLLRNRDRLRGCGITYPHPGHGHPGNAARIADLTASSFAALFADGADTVVLSHEGIFATELEALPLARLARDAGVTVQRVVFLRPWSEFVFGDYSQNMKQHFDRYVATRNPYDGLRLEQIALRRAAEVDPVAVLLRWSRVIPSPRLVLASHLRIADTIERLLGGPGLDWSMPLADSNPSLRVCDCESLARLIRRRSVPEDRLHDALRLAYEQAVQPDPGRTPDRRRWIEGLFDRVNRDMRAIYGYDNRADALTSAPETRPATAPPCWPVSDDTGPAPAVPPAAPMAPAGLSPWRTPPGGSARPGSAGAPRPAARPG